VIRLATRLAAGGGREAAVRLLLTAVGVALAVVLLLFGTVAYPALRAHDERRAWTLTSADNERPAQDEATTDPLLWRVIEARYDGRGLLRVDVAAEGPDAPVPPGLDRLPAPGEVAASPALAELIDEVGAARLGDRFPGRIVATLGPEALVAPDDLVAVVGRGPDELRAEPEVATVRSIEAAPTSRTLTTTMRLVVVVGVIGLLVPIAVFVTTATRLAAARREQRLAALRLAGATTRQVAGVAAVEAGLAAVAGVVAGVVAFTALRPRLARIPLDGAAFFPDDLRLRAGGTLAVVLGVPVLAVGAALASLARTHISPLGVARRATPARPSARGLLLVAVGLALLVGASTWARSSDAEVAETYAIGGGFLLLLLGVVLSGPWLVAGVAGGVARFGRGVPALLAGRRLQDDPGAGFRAISGVVLAVFVGSVFSGMAASMLADGATRSSGLGDDVVLAATPAPPYVPPAPDADRARADDTGPAPQRAVVAERATVADADALVDRVAAVDGVERVATGHALVDPEVEDELLAGGAEVLAPVLIRCDDAAALGFDGCSGTTAVNVARHGLSPTGVTVAVPPAELAELPVVAVAATLAPGASVEEVRTALEAAIPGGRAVTRADVDAESLEQFRTLQRVSDLGLAVTLVIAGCSLAVAAAGAVVERRRPFTLLRLAGTRLSELRRVVLTESAAPLVVVATATAALGLAVSALLVASSSEGSRPFALPGAGYWFSLVGGLVVALLVVASTLPLLTRLTSPDTPHPE
jgi:hypothetical protein